MQYALTYVTDNKSSNDMHSIFAFDLLKNLFKIMAKAANLSRPLKDVGKLFAITKIGVRK